MWPPLPVYLDTLRLHLTPVVLALAGLWVITTHWHPATEYDSPATQRDLIWIVVGIGLWVAALAAASFLPHPAPLSITITPRRMAPATLILSVSGAYLLAWLSFQVTPGLEVWGVKSSLQTVMMGRDSQLIWLFLGAALFVLGWLRPGEPRAILGGLRHSLTHQWREWLLVAGLTAAGLAVRLYKLDTLIPVIQSDEPQFCWPARQIADGTVFSFAGNMQTEQTFLGVFLVSYAIKLFGPTIFAARVLPAIIGGLAVPGVYLMARRIRGPLAGTLAALFLIGQPVHVYFSRTLMYLPFDPTLGIFASLLIWDGLERGGRWKFALAGVLIGFSQYLYTAARLWLLLLPLWLLLVCAANPRRFVRHHWANMLALGLGVLVIMLPMLGQIHMGNGSLTQRSYDMSYGYGDADSIFDISLREYVNDRLIPSLRLFFDRGDHSVHYDYGPHEAINLRLAFLAAAVGAAYALRFMRNRRVLFVGLWLLLTALLGGSLLHYLGFTRYTTGMLPMCILGGLGVAWAVDLAQSWLPERHHRLAAAAGLALMLAITAQNLTFILDTHPQRLINEFAPERWIADSLAHETLKVPKTNSTIIWISDPAAWNLRMREIYAYFNGSVDYALRDPPVTKTWIATLDTHRSDLYIFVPPTPDDSPDPYAPPAANSALWPLLRAFPDATLTRFNGQRYPTDHPPALYSLVYVPQHSPNLAAEP